MERGAEQRLQATPQVAVADGGVDRGCQARFRLHCSGIIGAATASAHSSEQSSMLACTALNSASNSAVHRDRTDPTS